MKSEHRAHLGLFRILYEKARIAEKAGFALTCDADEVLAAIEELAALRHEKANGWASHMVVAGKLKADFSIRRDTKTYDLARLPARDVTYD